MIAFVVLAGRLAETATTGTSVALGDDTRGVTFCRRSLEFQDGNARESLARLYIISMSGGRSLEVSADNQARTGVTVEPPAGPKIFFGDSHRRPRLNLDLNAAGNPRIMLHDVENKRSMIIR